MFFADMDGDGKEDYVWLDPNFVASLLINGGTDSAGKWMWLSEEVIADGVGAQRADVQLAGIEGDGKADCLWVGRVTDTT